MVAKVCSACGYLQFHILLSVKVYILRSLHGCAGLAIGVLNLAIVLPQVIKFILFKSCLLLCIFFLERKCSWVAIFSGFKVVFHVSLF